jgi:hypothetical protein
MRLTEILHFLNNQSVTPTELKYKFSHFNPTEEDYLLKETYQKKLKGLDKPKNKIIKELF